jgi:small subunit ribosomal protein S15
MSIKRDYSATVIDQFRKNEHDTGSVEVQVVMLSEQIKGLSEHFKKFPKDIASKRGLLKMVAQRRKSLEYLKRKNPEVHKKLLDQLSIRK